MTTNLTTYKPTGGLELYIDNVTSEAFASQRGIARMCEVSEAAIRQLVTAKYIEGKTAEVLTATGLKTAKLHTENTIVLCVTKYKFTL